MAIEKGGVLFLDLSLRTGWCYGTLANLEHGPEWGVWLLPSVSHLGKRLVALENELADAIFELQPCIVGIEAPLAAGAIGSAATAELLICLAGAAESVTTRWERDFKRYGVNTLRAEVCGRSRLNDAEKDDRLNVKDAIVAPWLKRMGWNIPENNAADAAVGWAYTMGCRHTMPKPRAVPAGQKALSW